MDPGREAGRSYYQHTCFKISLTIEKEEKVTIDLVDGGFTNWTQLLLSNKKEGGFLELCLQLLWDFLKC